MRIAGFAFIAIILRYSVPVEAQNSNALDEKNAPISASVFGSGKGDSKSQSGCSIRTKRILKMPLAEILRKELSVKFEYQLKSHFSVNGLVGTPTGKDNIECFWSDVVNTDDCFAIQNSSLFKSGYIYGLSLKYYFNEKNFAFPFCEFGYKNVFRKYQITRDGYTPNEISDKMDYFLLSIGNLWVKGYNKTKITQEFSFGLGFKIVSWDTFDAKNILDSDGYIVQMVYEKNPKRDFYSSPIISIRYNLGIGW